MVVGETAGLEDYGAQLGDATATRVVEVHKRKAGPGHRILQERDRRRPRQAMLAAQKQKSADQAMTAVSVIITAACPVIEAIRQGRFINGYPAVQKAAELGRNNPAIRPIPAVRGR
jgi:hypothetical protein